MKLHKRDIVELIIDKMAYGGQGIARLDGFVIFVKGAVAGDRLKARIIKKKKDYAEAGITELIEPSPDRVQAPCPYSGFCGGCQWQHVRYEKQVDYKKGHVREAMEHIGGLKNVLIRDVVPSENRFAYRNKMEFSFSGRRWFPPHELDGRETESGFALGLHVPRTFNKVIDMEACLLQRETGNRILREVKKFAKDSNVPVYGLKTHVGFWRFLMIRYSTAFDEWMVNLVTSEERPEIVHPLAEILSRRVKGIKTVVNNINTGRAAIAVGERETVLLGKGYIEDRIGEFNFKISANSFFQTNSLSAEKLYGQVVDFAELRGNETVLDLYSGTGAIPIFMSKRVKSIIGMEISRDAVSDARRNCTELGIDNCRFVQGDIRERLSSIAERPHILIIDPPRAGMHKDVLSQVLALSPEKIVYVSCNPATMARDIGLMSRDYDVLEIQPVDMFPHTYHIEAVAKLLLRAHA